MTIRCIAFDLDDTLWDCQPVIQQAEKKLYEWLTDYYPKITQHYSFAALMQHRNAFMANHSELVHDLTQLRRQWLHYLAIEFAYPLQMVEPAFNIFWLARNQVQLYDGVRDILDKLSQRFSLGVISNGNADVHHIGIGAWFDFTVSAAEAGVAKPHPSIFQLALKKAQCEAKEMIYVGDDLVRDVQGATQAGLHAIWYQPKDLTGQGDGQPRYIINHFNQLEESINTLSGDLLEVKRNAFH